MTDAYLAADIAATRKLLVDFYSAKESDRIDFADELIATIPKWLEIAEEFNESLADDEVESVEEIEERLTPQMMILKGTELIQRGNNLIEQENSVIISHLIQSKQLDPVLKAQLEQLYDLHDGAIGTLTNFWVTSKTEPTIKGS